MKTGYPRYFWNLPDCEALGVLLRELHLPHGKSIKRPDLLTAEIVGDLSSDQYQAIFRFYSEQSKRHVFHEISHAEMSFLVTHAADSVSVPGHFAKCALDLGIDISLRYSRFEDDALGVVIPDGLYDMYAELLVDGPLRNIVHLSYHDARSQSLTRRSRWAAGEYIPELSSTLSGLATSHAPPLSHGWIRIEFQEFTRFFLGGILTGNDLAALGVSSSQDIQGIEFFYESAAI